MIEAFLQIDYSSLVDVRIVKHGNFNSGKAVASEVNEVFVDNQTAVSGFGASNNNRETPAPTQGIYFMLFSCCW